MSFCVSSLCQDEILSCCHRHLRLSAVSQFSICQLLLQAWNWNSTQVFRMPLKETIKIVLNGLCSVLIYLVILCLLSLQELQLPLDIESDSTLVFHIDPVDNKTILQDERFFFYLFLQFTCSVISFVCKDILKCLVH